MKDKPAASLTASGVSSSLHCPQSYRDLRSIAEKKLKLVYSNTRLSRLSLIKIASSGARVYKTFVKSTFQIALFRQSHKFKFGDDAGFPPQGELSILKMKCIITFPASHFFSDGHCRPIPIHGSCRAARVFGWHCLSLQIEADTGGYHCTRRLM